MVNNIAIHVGQAGNQLGLAFWSELCKEHGINEDGFAAEETGRGVDNKDVYFYEADNGRYVPRAVVADLEPRVLAKVQQAPFGALYNPENVYSAAHGGGAGNSWASGFEQGAAAYEAILEVVQREAENADFLEALTLTHSIGGGTGSGLGSRLLEALRDRYPRKLVQTYSVFPVKGESNVVVEPYNSVLALSRLTEYADLCTVVDNKALNGAASSLGCQKASFEVLNSMVAKMMADASAPMRTYSSVLPRFTDMFASLAPFSGMHFISTAYCPFVLPGVRFSTLKTSTSDIMSRLLKPSALMLSAESRFNEPHYFTAGMVMLQSAKGAVDFGDFMMETMDRSEGLFPSWCGMHLRPVLSVASAHVPRAHRVSGLLLANHTKFLNVLDGMGDAYDRLNSKQAYHKQYEREYGADFLQEMALCREKLAVLADLYRDAKSDNFLGTAPADENLQPKPEPLHSDSPGGADLPAWSEPQMGNESD